MEILSALFNAISDRLTGSAWFPYVQWPLWVFVILIALGGVYTACFQKNTLFCRGVTGALKLTLVYLCYYGIYRLAPNAMEFVKEFPFLNITKDTVTLVNPLTLLKSFFTDFPKNMVQLYWLLFFLNFCGHVDYGGRSKSAWTMSQFFSCPIAVCLYQLLGIPFATFFNWLGVDMKWLYVAVSVVLLLPLGILMAMKYIFIVFRKSGNPTYSKIMQYLSGQGFLALFFVTFFSVLVVLTMLVIMHLYGMGSMARANFNHVGYSMLIILCSLTLLVYSMYYTERKLG